MLIIGIQLLCQIMNMGHIKTTAADNSDSGVTSLPKSSNNFRSLLMVAQANHAIAEMLKKETQDTLDKVLFELSSQMKNAYSRSDA